MADLFDGMKRRMDALIAERFGMKVNINGTDCIVVESDFLAELGPVEGNGKNVVVFSGNVIPRRGDRVVLRGSEFTVTRIRRFNGKPQLTLEENNGGIPTAPPIRLGKPSR
ncbi:ATP-binding protein [Salmonella enterica]|nr:ATP-binding protein [Salmonella enterica]